MVKEAWVFDGQEQRRGYECRREFLERLLRDPSIGPGPETALDAGCGIGLFSAYLSSLGLKVAAFDARHQNIAEARIRFPGIEFCTRDVEDPGVRELGQFDLVLCFGLLYHLENPFQAIRNLHALTGRILIIESMVTPSQFPVATLMSECLGEDQGLDYIAFVPSEACIIKLLYNAGFPEVYKTVELPMHEDYRETLFRRRRRTVVVAAKTGLQSPLLLRVAEPQPHRPDIWRKKLVLLMQPIASLFGKSLGRIHAGCAKVRSRFA